MEWDKIDAHLAAALGESSLGTVFAVFVDRRDSMTPLTTMAAREQLDEMSRRDEVVRIRLATAGAN